MLESRPFSGHAARLLLAAVVLLAACGKSSGPTASNNNSSAGTGSFSIAFAPSTVFVIPGGLSMPGKIRVTRTGGFALPITLAAPGGLPTGVTAGMTPNPVSGDSADLTITASASSTINTYRVPISATASPAPQQSADLYIGVVSNAAATLSVNPASIVIPKGGSGTVTLSVTPNPGNKNPVLISFQGITSLISITANPNPVPSVRGVTSVTVSINVDTKQAAGTTPVTVVATSTGVVASTTTFNIQVPFPTTP